MCICLNENPRYYTQELVFYFALLDVSTLFYFSIKTTNLVLVS